MVAAIWANTERADVNDGLQATDAAINGLHEVWPEFALYNWNRDPINFYKTWDGLAQGAKSYTFDISTPGETQVPTDVAHLSARYFNFTFTGSTVRKVIFEHPFASGSEPTAKVQALAKIGGSWQQVEDWTGTQKKGYCRDKPEEDIEELVVIVSNSEWQNASHVLSAGQAKLTAEKAPCDVGNGQGGSSFISDWDYYDASRQWTGKTVVETSDYVFTPSESSDDTMLMFDLVGVKVSMSGEEQTVADSGLVCSWSYSYDGTLSVSADEAMGTLQVFPGGLEGMLAEWAYMGTGGTAVEVDVTGGCDGSSTSYKEPRVLEFYNLPGFSDSDHPVVQAGGVMSGTRTYPHPAPVDGVWALTSTWNFQIPGLR